MATSYSNPGGTGDRTASITVTVRTGLFNNAATAIAGLINGNTTENTWWFTAAITDGWMKFDFGVGVTKIIDTFKWYQSNNTNHGTWKWYSSPDDITYTARGSAITLAGPPGGGSTEFTEPAGNTVAARYWKLNQESGSTSSGPFLREIEFHIDVGLTTLNMVAAQTLPAITQSFTLSLVAVVTAAQTLPTITQTATMEGPTPHLVAHQTLPVLTQTVTLKALAKVGAAQTLPVLPQHCTMAKQNMAVAQTLPMLTNGAYGLANFVHATSGSSSNGRWRIREHMSRPRLVH